MSGAAGKFEGRVAEGVIAKLVKNFVKDAERLAARAGEKQAAKDAEKAAAKQATKLTDAFKKSYRERFFKAHPETRGKVWVHHSLEKDLEKRYPGLFTDSELHELANFRGIPNDINRDLHLSNMRRAWNGFYKNFPDATRNEVRAFRDMLDQRWGEFYNPPM